MKILPRPAARPFACLAALVLSALSARAADVDVLELGAIGDGRTLNTAVLQQAIDRCSETGGGQVIFRPGAYLSGSLILRSGVHLNIRRGATLLGSTRLEDYQAIKPDYVALRTRTQTRQLIFAEGQTDIGITGEGTIDGQGAVFVRQSEDEGIQRPHGIQLINCRNVTIEGVFLTSSGAWMQHYLACDNLRIRGIRVYNHCNYNNDGIDIDGCHDVVISDCIVDSDDDGICLKSTSPRGCRNVTISNCVVHSHCNALKLGTESTGGFENILISKCVVSPCAKQTVLYGQTSGQSAISVEMVDGGALEQVSIDSINVLETACPIFVRLGNRARKYAPEAPEPPMGRMSGVSITNVTARTSQKVTCNISGIPGGCATDIHLGNILIFNTSEGTAEDAKRVVPEKDAGYPTFNMLGDILPASGFYVRHVKSITFDNVRLVLSAREARPAFVLDDVHGAAVRFPSIRGAAVETVVHTASSEVDVVAR